MSRQKSALDSKIAAAAFVASLHSFNRNEGRIYHGLYFRLPVR